MSDSTPPNDRLRELQAERALFGLGEEELSELHTLSGGLVDNYDDLALAAAALDLAHHNAAGVDEPAPEDLRLRTLEKMRQAAAEPSREPVDAVGAKKTLAVGDPRASGGGMRWRELAGWLTAAAAIVVAAFLFVRQPTGEEESPIDMRNRMAALKERDPASVVAVPWTKGNDPVGEGVSGRLLWSDAEDRGVMEFRGLAANDPRENQYQLWIFDADRPEATPVDGGVFNVPPGQGEAVIPIRAHLPVSKATLFAVSIEKPGGVVVSDRARLPVVAPVAE